MSQLCNFIPQALQGAGIEVRTFMPRFGSVNERRNQLHEVIRLSGINISINDNDHPLIIKVASMQPSRIQVYFIDNDDYFQKAADDVDALGTNRPDNDERVIFYARGVVETAKKLKWAPNLVHYNGWFSALGPIYMRRLYRDEPAFKNSKIVFAVSPCDLSAPVSDKLLEKMRADGILAKDIKKFKDLPFDLRLLHKIAIANSDGVIFEGGEPDSELLEYTESLGLPHTSIPADLKDIEPVKEFYTSVLEKDKKK